MGVKIVAENYVKTESGFDKSPELSTDELADSFSSASKIDGSTGDWV